MMTTKDPLRTPAAGVSDTGRDRRPDRPEDRPATAARGEPARPEDTGAWRRMPLYGSYYGLLEPPFELTPNPRFLFLSSRQREALSNLRYALATSKGFTLILGEAGTGKTTLVRTALAELGDTPSRYVMVSNPTLDRQEFYEYLAQEFGLSSEARVSKTRFLSELQRQVEARFATGGLTGLIIDEAQSMPHELLEEIRLLGNIETATTKLLSIVLSGQPELADRLNDPSLRQLKQRLALRCELKPLTLDETAAYISGRLRIAGGLPGQIFTRETVVAIYNYSGGIPRTINVLCDNALIGGYAAQVKPISLEIVQDVCADFDLGPEAVAPPRVETLPIVPAPAVPQPGSPAQGRPHGEGGRSEADRQMFGSFGPKGKRRFTFFS